VRRVAAKLDTQSIAATRTQVNASSVWRRCVRCGKFYRSIVRSAVREFWTATDEVLTAIAIISFLIILVNRKFGEYLVTAWNGISPWWSTIPVALLVLYRLLRANYEQFAKMKKERDDTVAKLEAKTGIPPYHPKIVIDHYGKKGNASGLFISNDGYPAYQISIPDVVIGATGSRLTFSRKLSRLIDKQGEQFFEAWLEHSNGRLGSDAGKLHSYMAFSDTDALMVNIIYNDGEYNKDEQFSWYRSNFAVERDSSADNGLTVIFVSQELIQKPIAA
jgi:hypothetical protein